MKKSILIIVCLLMVSAIFYLVYSNSTSKTPETPLNPYAIDTNGKEVTIEGVLACIPSNTNPTTLECLIGLQDNNGEYYRLIGISAEEMEKHPVGEKIKVRGVVSASVNFGISIDVKEIYAN